jgi:hypothetical protein
VATVVEVMEFLLGEGSGDDAELVAILPRSCEIPRFEFHFWLLDAVG